MTSPESDARSAVGLPPAFPEGRGLLEGRNAVITAAAGAGIGSAIASRMALEGARLVISDRHERRLSETRRQLSEHADVIAIPADVSDADAIDSLLAAAEREIGPVDIMVNNAGLGGSCDVVDMADEVWESLLNVSLTSAFRGTRAALQRMLPRGRGSIINLASITGWRAEAGQAHYAAAKAGVMALTRCAAVEAAPHGDRVNAVAPTLTMHPHMTSVIDEATLRNWIASQPHGRAAHPTEIATVVAFLASDYASYMTGEVVSVGGQHP